MTGPEHYAEAERLLAHVEEHGHGGLASAILAAAQVHATLALARASLGSPYRESDWASALGESKRK